MSKRKTLEKWPKGELWSRRSPKASGQEQREAFSADFEASTVVQLVSSVFRACSLWSHLIFISPHSYKDLLSGQSGSLLLVEALFGRNLLPRCMAYGLHLETWDKSQLISDGWSRGCTDFKWRISLEAAPTSELAAISWQETEQAMLREPTLLACNVWKDLTHPQSN